MVMLRNLGVNLPIVLCSNKTDLLEDESIVTDEFLPLINEFKEIESCIRCSAKDKYNVNQSFYLCQRAVRYPLSPLYDSQQNVLKPSLVLALQRIFLLCDKDQDGYLNDKELLSLQKQCFGKSLDINELQKIKGSVNGLEGLSQDSFILLNEIFIQSGRHETTWGILRAFHYTDSLSLDSDFLYPSLDVPSTSSVELSPIGYRFLVDLFILFDKDNDGGLNEIELTNLFRPTPGVPMLWEDLNFPHSTVRNEQGHVTLQGWLAQWSMSTLLDYKATLEYLGYLGFEKNTISALKVTKPRRTRRINNKVYRTLVADRTVFSCFVLGSPGSGKSSLLDTFLQQPYNDLYIPTIHQRTVVNSVEIKGGKQYYLVLEELGQLEPAVLENASRLLQCDVIAMIYDSSDPDSFHYLVELRQKWPLLDRIPLIYVALKADLDKQQQRTTVQPEAYTKQIQVDSPLHVSCNWQSSVQELFLRLADAAQNPSQYTPNMKDDLNDDDTVKNFVFAAATIGSISAVVMGLWKLSSR